MKLLKRENNPFFENLDAFHISWIDLKNLLSNMAIDSPEFFENYNNDIQDLMQIFYKHGKEVDCSNRNYHVREFVIWTMSIDINRNTWLITSTNFPLFIAKLLLEERIELAQKYFKSIWYMFTQYKKHIWFDNEPNYNINIVDCDLLLKYSRYSIHNNDTYIFINTIEGLEILKDYLISRGIEVPTE